MAGYSLSCSVIIYLGENTKRAMRRAEDEIKKRKVRDREITVTFHIRCHCLPFDNILYGYFYPHIGHIIQKSLSSNAIAIDL
jgi:hypothetical protein